MAPRERLDPVRVEWKKGKQDNPHAHCRSSYQTSDWLYSLENISTDHGPDWKCALAHTYLCTDWSTVETLNATQRLDLQRKWHKIAIQHIVWSSKSSLLKSLYKLLLDKRIYSYCKILPKACFGSSPYVPQVLVQWCEIIWSRTIKPVLLRLIKCLCCTLSEGLEKYIQGNMLSSSELKIYWGH